MPQHINRERSPKREPVTCCIPVAWSTADAHWLAYHHGWTDARLYNVVKIHRAGPQDAFAGYLAAVDDFGDLVPITNRPFLQRGAIELH